MEITGGLSPPRVRVHAATCRRIWRYIDLHQDDGLCVVIRVVGFHQRATAGDIHSALGHYESGPAVLERFVEVVGYRHAVRVTGAVVGMLKYASYLRCRRACRHDH